MLTAKANNGKLTFIFRCIKYVLIKLISIKLITTHKKIFLFFNEYFVFIKCKLMILSMNISYRIHYNIKS